MARGELLELRIDKLISSGAGLGRESIGPTAGRAVFVRDTAPGDVVRVSLIREHRRYAEARLEHVVEAGASRVEPYCPLVGACGGCDWQHVSGEAQVAARADFVRAALRNVPREADAPPIPDGLVAGERRGYRARVRLHVAGQGAELTLGYHARASRRVVDVATCPVATEPINAALEPLRGHLADLGVRRGTVVVTSGDGPVAAVSLRTDPPAPPLPEVPEAVTRSVPGRDGDLRLRVSAGAFCQAHTKGNRLLVGHLLERWEQLPGHPERTAELFSGGGNLTLPLALAGARILAVENEPLAAADLRANLDAHGCGERVEVLEEDARGSQVAARLHALAPERIVLDPPREGARELMPLIGDLAPRCVVYVSCDPATLGRDLGELATAGFVLREAVPVHLFPETPHVETIAYLVRS